MEVTIYIALFSILIGGAVVCAFHLFETAATGGTYTLLTEESDFLLGKISWELMGATDIVLPLPGARSDQLTLTPHDTSEAFVHQFRERGGYIVLTQEKEFELSSPDVTVEQVSFTHVTEPLEGVETVLTLSARTPQGILLTHVATSTVYRR